MYSKTNYIHANGRIIAQHDGDQEANRYFYLHDRLGSVRQIVNTDGVIENYYLYYEPWGSCATSAENISNWYRFAGYYEDPEVSQYFCNARQYETFAASAKNAPLIPFLLFHISAFLPAK